MAYCIENGVINVEWQSMANINMAYHISASLPAISSGSQRWLAAANRCSWHQRVWHQASLIIWRRRHRKLAAININRHHRGAGEMAK
jgi:hypothetical protein